MTRHCGRWRRHCPANPQYYHALILSGRIHHSMGNHAAAQEDFDRAVALARRRPEAFLHRAWLRFDQARYAEGLEDALQAKQLNRGDLEFEAWVLEARLLEGIRLPIETLAFGGKAFRLATWA